MAREDGRTNGRGRATMVALVLTLVVALAALAFVWGGFGATGGDPGTAATDIETPPAATGAIEPAPPRAPD